MTGPARNLELEQAICDNLQDQQAWSVYADWLQARGDPAGELMSLQLALESADAPTRVAIDAARRALFERYLDIFGAWLDDPIEGRPAVLPRTKIRLHRNFIDHLQVTTLAGPRVTAAEVQAPLRKLLGSAGARFMRKLQLTSRSWAAVTELLAELGPQPSLRHLTLEDPGWRAWEQYGWDDPVSELMADPVFDYAPRLTELDLRVDALELDQPPTHATLERLSIHARDLRPSVVTRLAEARLPCLKRLTLAPGPSTSLDADSFEELFATGMPKLSGLSIHAWDDFGVALDELIRSPLLARLGSLTLDFEGLDESHDEYLQRILDHAHRFQHASILLMYVRAARPLVQALKDALPRVDIEGSKR